MNTTPKPRLSHGEAAEQMRSALRKVKDAISRIEDCIEDNRVSGQSCAYIDGQGSKAIGWLASMRAIAVNHGNLDEPEFDTGELVDLDDPRGLVERFEDATQGKGGAS